MIQMTDTIYAGRLNGQGDVRLLQFVKPPLATPYVHNLLHPADLIFDVVIPAASWAATVAHVSRLGDAGARFYVAQAFHQDAGQTNGAQAPSSPSQG